MGANPPAPNRGYERAARRAGSQSARSWPVTGSVIPPIPPPIGPLVLHGVTEEPIRLLALKLRPEEVGVIPPMAGECEPGPDRIGLTAAELEPVPLPAMPWVGVPPFVIRSIAPGVLAPPVLPDERQTPAGVTFPPAVEGAPLGLVRPLWVCNCMLSLGLWPRIGLRLRSDGDIEALWANWFKICNNQRNKTFSI